MTPSRRPAGWQPSDPARFSALDLDEPDPEGRMPDWGSVAQLLAYALMPPGADDPITGILDAVGIELRALASAHPPRPQADALSLLARRLEVASHLLRRLDNRIPSPPISEEPEAPESDDTRRDAIPPSEP